MRVDTVQSAPKRLAVVTATADDTAWPATPAPVVLHIQCLRMTAGDFKLAIDDLRIDAGCRLGVIGRNGCGKTTMLEACLGLRDAQTREGQLLGAPISDFSRRPSLRSAVGCVLQQSTFSAFTRVREVLDLHRALYGRAWPELHVRLRLDEISTLRARLLSRGQRQRLELYLALAHRPRLVLMDEPLTGLDRRYIDVVSELLHGSELADTAFVIIGHAPEELSLMREVAWLHEGRLVARGSAEQLVERFIGPQRIRIGSHSQAQADSLEARICALPCVRRHHRESATTVSAFGDDGLDAHVQAWRDDRLWDSFESGNSRLEDLIRVGPDAAASQVTP